MATISRPPKDPITTQRSGESWEHWRLRDESAKAARERIRQTNEWRSQSGFPLEPEPNWAEWNSTQAAFDYSHYVQPHIEVLDRSVDLRGPGVLISVQASDIAFDWRWDHFGWQALVNAERYGKVIAAPLERPANFDIFTALGPAASTAVQVLTMLGGASGFAPQGRARYQIIGVPGQGTHSYHDSPNNWQSDHAVDVRIPVGTKVYALADGRISTSFGYGDTGQGGRFEGKRLHIEFGDDVAYYAHLSRIVVPRGAYVKAGQLIGYSGSANNTPHLHLATRNSDPLDWVRHGHA